MKLTVQKLAEETAKLVEAIAPASEKRDDALDTFLENCGLAPQEQESGE